MTLPILESPSQVFSIPVLPAVKYVDYAQPNSPYAERHRYGHTGCYLVAVQVGPSILEFGPFGSKVAATEWAIIHYAGIPWHQFSNHQKL